MTRGADEPGPASHAVRYQNDLTGIRASDLRGFFEGWPAPPSPDRHLAILERSTHVVLALAGSRVVGFANAISDRELSGYIPLLEVLPPWRRGGVGSELIRRLLAEIGPLYMIDAVCDPPLAGFYERLGFRQLVGMARRNTGAFRSD